MLAVAVFIRRYADHSQMETHCYVTLFVAYVAAVGIVLLCPPDLALTLDGRNHPDQDHQDAFRKYSQNELLYFYMTCYWCCFALNSILQFQELYMVSGAFTYVWSGGANATGASDSIHVTTPPCPHPRA
jgi:hypothetical protein